MQPDAFSLTVANTCILPSGSFLPAMPEIFDDPNSIATINSVAAISYFSFLVQII